MHTKDVTLQEKLTNHNNNYAFNVEEVIDINVRTNLPSISVIIPYYNVGELFVDVLQHLIESLVNIRHEILVIDDGSDRSKASEIIKNHFSTYSHIRLIENKRNLGRSLTRGIGLANAKNEICLFMDADIIVDNTLIFKHLCLHEYAKNERLISIITVSFFEFTDTSDKRINKYPLEFKDIRLNDFRIECVYKDTWIGCDDDKKFIGKKYKIVEDTEYFRNWIGQYGPWLLCNMVLGGFFMVNRIEALKVGGFSKLFIGYGFTETPLAAKLIGLRGNFVVPVTSGGCLHIGGTTEELDQSEKDKVFRQKHDLFFNKYLKTNILELEKSNTNVY